MAELHPHPEEYEQFLGCMKQHVFGPYAAGFNPDKDKLMDILTAPVKGSMRNSLYEYDTIGKLNWYSIFLLAR